MPPAAENGTGIVLGLFEELINDGKKFAADAIGEETAVADITEIAVWNMSDKFGKEITDRQRDGLSSIGIMVKIFEDDQFAIVGFDA